jgi:hypothetical protein
MSGRLIRVETDGTFTTHFWTGARPWPLSLMQRLVGGYIERVKIKYDGRLRDAYVDEEGLVKGLRTNLFALHTAGLHLVGPLVIWIPDPHRAKPGASKSTRRPAPKENVDGQK